jgi:P22 coat protein - gene protein 5
MPAITSSNVAQAIVKLVAFDALPALEANLLMGSLVNRNYEQSLAQTGDTVNIPIPGVLQANNIADGGSVQLQNPSLGNAQVVLNKHIESSFQIPDVTKVLAFPNLLEQYMRPAVIAVATQIESDLLNLYTNLTANTPVGTGGSGLAYESVVDSAERALFNALVPDADPKYLITSSSAYSDLRQIQRFTEDRILAGEGQALRTGTVGIIKGFKVFRSQLVAAVGGTTYNLAFAPDAFALVTRQLPQPLPGTGAIAQYTDEKGFGLRVVMSYAPNTLAQQFTVDVLYGVTVLRNVFGVQVLS